MKQETYDIKKLLDDHHVRYEIGTGNEYFNVTCPFPSCGDRKLHGGISVFGYYSCWRCGWRPIEAVIRMLINKDWDDIKEKYSSIMSHRDRYQEETKPKDKLELPYGSKELTKNHRKYLKDRNFDPDYLIENFGLKGTSHLGKYKYRIIAPIYYNGKLVSFQGRDITDESQLKYKACPLNEEIVSHKTILYNIDNARYEGVVVVEGITDVWRMGHGSVATFGIGFRNEQVNLLSKFEKVFILYDADALGRADKLAEMLSGLGVDANVVMLHKGDPADLSQEEADDIMSKLLGG